MNGSDVPPSSMASTFFARIKRTNNVFETSFSTSTASTFRKTALFADCRFLSLTVVSVAANNSSKYASENSGSNLTKFIGGHGTSIGGIIVDSGNFDWEAFPERQPALNNPDPSYGGAIWTEAVKPLGPIAYILKARTTILRDMGAAMSPFNAFMFIQGLETLALRMREHSSNAEKVAEYLSNHDSVESVSYPSHMEGYAKERADKYLSKGNGGLMGFEIKGGIEAGKKFINALEMVYHVANIGDSRSLAIHPGSTTHSQLNEEELLAAGITPGYVRLSIGLEHIDDIIADFEQALAKI